MYNTNPWQTLQKAVLHSAVIIKAYLGTFKYLFIAVITSLLAGVYLYQSIRVSHYQAGAGISFFSQQGASATAKKHLFKQLYNQLAAVNRHITVSETTRPNTITVNAEAKTAHKAESYIRELIVLYRHEVANQHSRQAYLRTIDDSLKKLKSKLLVLNEKIRLSGLEKAVSFAERAELKAKFEKQLAVLDVIKNYVSKPITSFVVVPDNFIPQEDDLQILIGKFNDLELQKQTYIGARSLNDASTARFNQQIKFLQGQIKHVVNTKRAYIQKQLMPDTAAVFALKQNRLLAAFASAAIDSLNTLKKTVVPVKPAKAGLSITVTHFTTKPVHAQSALLYLRAVLAGIFLSILAVYGSYRLNNKISNQADIKRLTTIPVAGEINLNAQNDTAETVRDFSVKSLLTFMSNLNSYYKTLWITADTDEGGVKYLGFRLADELTHAGKKTLLIDNETLGAQAPGEMGIPYTKGLYEYLNADMVTVDELVVPVSGSDNLYFIGSGSSKNQHKTEMASMLDLLEIAPNVSEESEPLKSTAPGKKFNQLLHELQKQFDCLIICGPLLDDHAPAITAGADITVCLVTYKATHKWQLTKLNELLKAGKLINPVIVANYAAAQPVKYI